MTSWNDAAERYRAKNPEVLATRHKEEIDRAVRELDAFSQGREGAMARDLLTASKRFIRVGESGPEGGWTMVYILDKDGFQCATESAGSGSAYAALQGQPRQSTLKPISTQDFVQRVATASAEHRSPLEILPYIRQKLDEIAEAAPPAK